MKKRPTHPKTGKKSQTERYFIDGKWITREERAAVISECKAEISRIDETFVVCEQSVKAMSDLICLTKREVASGEAKLATQHLFMCTVEIVGALNELARDRPAVLRPIARESLGWPTFTFRKKSLNRAYEKLMTVLQLGEDADLTNKKWHPSAPSTRAAMALYLIGQALKRAGRLPLLTSESKRRWFEESWKSCLELGVKPEENGLLAPLGKSAVGKKSTSRGMSKQTNGMRRDDVRAEIKRQVWSAFDKVIAGAQK